MSGVTINQNIAECIRSTSHIGGTTVRNICSGVEAYVPWGSLDWLVLVGVSMLVVSFVAAFAGMALDTWRGR